MDRMTRSVPVADHDTQLLDALADVVHDIECFPRGLGRDCDPEVCNRHDGDGAHVIANAVLDWLPSLLERHPEALAAALGMRHRRDTGFGHLVGPPSDPLLFHDLPCTTAAGKHHQRHVLSQPWTVTERTDGD